MGRLRAGNRLVWMSIEKNPDHLMSLDSPWRLAHMPAAIYRGLPSSCIAGLGHL